MKNLLQSLSIIASCVLMLVSLCLTANVCSVAHAEKTENTVPCIADGSSRKTASVIFTQGETALFCRFISEECRDQPYICRVGAAAVVLNRMANAGYPDTVEKVILSAGEFTSVENYTIGVNISKEDLDLSMQAVRQAISGEDPTGGALYFSRESADAPVTSVSFRAGDMEFGW